VPDVDLEVADLDDLSFIEFDVHLAARHGDLEALGLDGGVGEDFVAGFRGSTDRGWAATLVLKSSLALAMP